MTALKNIDVFILCGGLGKRLMGVSGDRPKPMVEIGEQPFLDIIINYLKNLGFRRFILGLGYKGKAIESYYRNKNKGSARILFSYEKTPLDTGGALKNSRAFVKSNPFMVLNGDSFSEFVPQGLLKFHNHKKSLVTILLKKACHVNDYGRVRIAKNSRVISFIEKGKVGKEGLVNTGIYIFNKKVFNLMPKNNKFSLEKEFFPKIVGAGIYGYVKSGFFIDIGTPERYFVAQKYLSDKLKK